MQKKSTDSIFVVIGAAIIAVGTTITSLASATAKPEPLTN